MAKTFAFRANARAVVSKDRYREETEGERICWHISVDPRVARGSVYSHHKPPSDAVKPIRYRPRQISPVKEDLPPGQEEEEIVENPDFTPTLLEIEDRPIEEDLATAKDTYIERPPTPHFVPDEPGVDASTQVYDGDLFNFDGEVRPIIKVIVQHTLLRALAEVHEEVEVENIQRHRDRYEVERNVILAELQRLEAKEQRKFEEDKRRRKQREEAEKELHEKNAEFSSVGFAQYYATDVMMGAVDLLEERAYFYDEIESDVNANFLPWLSDELGTVLEVKDVLISLRQSARDRALEIRAKKKEAFQAVVKEEDELTVSKKQEVLRRMIVEDRGSTKIRQARRDYREQKEREAAEAAARAEAEEAAAAEAAERAAAAPREEPESD
jgi:hypothetical protein